MHWFLKLFISRILTKFLRMPLPGSWKTKTGSPNHSFIQLLEGLVVGKTQLWLSNFLEKIHSQKIASDLQSESSSLVLKGLTVSPMHNPFCKEFIHSFKILCLHSFNIEKLYHQQVCWRLWNFIARQMEINNVFFLFSTDSTH